MKTPEYDQTRLLGLIAGVLEGDLDETGRGSLDSLLKASPAARRFYREHMELHARLHLDYAVGQATAFMPGSASTRRVSRFSIRNVAIVAAAACLTLLAAITWPPQDEAVPFATLQESRAARWESSDLPTSPGSRLAGGTLRLAEGLVTIRFDSGAELQLEAPAELTLLDAMRCTLTSGNVVADVPDSAKGFRIDTPTTAIIDFGTRFSVIADASTGRTHTRVFEGLVEVENPASGEKVSLTRGQTSTSGAAGLFKVKNGMQPEMWPASIGPVTRGTEWIQMGTSKDAYIGRAFEQRAEVHRSESLLLLKNGDVHRKAYLGFDLGGIEANRVADAELTLHFAPTGWGLASLVPDSTFSVYGLLTEEAWDEKTLTEENAPANTWRSDGLMDGVEGDPKLVDSMVRRLGSFQVKQGVQQGHFAIQHKSLTAFLRERAGGEATLVIVRDTVETETNGLVHGFASRRHPTLRPPTLAIRLETP